MGLFKNIGRLLKPDVTVITYGSAEPIVEGMSPSDLYETQPNLRTVIEFLARNIAQLPLRVYREDTNKRVLDATSAISMLLRFPNPDQTGYELIFQTVSDLKLHDSAIWLVGRNSQSKSGYEIRAIPPDWVVSYGEGNAFAPSYIEFSNAELGTEIVRAETGQFIIFHGYNPSSPRYGTSPITALKQTLIEQINAQEYRRSIWKNGGRIPAYISRPKDAGEWSDSAFNRFKRDLKENWAKSGAKSGSMPILEDGMKIETNEFNAREAQWVEGAQLSFNTVCNVYHVNPAIVGSNEGQTYASVKDNARALYADTLAPDLRFISERINQFLFPLVGADKDLFCEFDISVKLKGSFEEETTALQSSVGGPWRTRNEARATQGLAPVPGGDELIVPLNVVLGGQASPTDSAPKAHDTSDDQSFCECKSTHKKVRGTAKDKEVEAYKKVLSQFFKRQGRSVIPKIRAAQKSGDPNWWDAERWNRELAEDLLPVIMSGSLVAASDACKQLGLPSDAYNVERTRNYLKKIAESRAQWINDTTLAELLKSLAGDYESDAVKHDPDGVFKDAQETRSSQSAQTIATTVAGWSVIEAARQLGGGRATKTWHTTSGNPRRSHARLNGQTVAVESPFSNGAYWPGDARALPPEEVANCRCVVSVNIPD